MLIGCTKDDFIHFICGALSWEGRWDCQCLKLGRPAEDGHTNKTTPDHHCTGESLITRGTVGWAWDIALGPGRPPGDVIRSHAHWPSSSLSWSLSIQQPGQSPVSRPAFGCEMRPKHRGGLPAPLLCTPFARDQQGTVVHFGCVTSSVPKSGYEVRCWRGIPGSRQFSPESFCLVALSQ